MTAQPDPAPKTFRPTLILIAFLGLVALWSYWTTLGRLVGRWSEDPQYSHGYLVPAFALYLLWLRRDRLLRHSSLILPSEGRAWGLGLAFLGLAAALRLGGAYYSFEYFDQISLLPCCAGIFLLAGSTPALYWSWPSVAFLAFMIPLPDIVSSALSAPMQSFATAAGTFALQVIGRPAIAEGNVILLNDMELGIVEACSGLRMLVVFFALSTAVAILVRKPLWEKLFLACSALPIALASNVLRIAVTGLFYDTFGNHFGGAFFHDLAGWLMMPLGLGFLGIELWILKNLLVERSSGRLVESQVSLQRVELSPLALYQSGQASSRQRTASSEPAPTPVAEPEPVPVAPAAHV
jgi:exosortase